MAPPILLRTIIHLSAPPTAIRQEQPSHDLATHPTRTSSNSKSCTQVLSTSNRRWASEATWRRCISQKEEIYV